MFRTFAISSAGLLAGLALMVTPSVSHAQFGPAVGVQVGTPGFGFSLGIGQPTYVAPAVVPYPVYRPVPVAPVWNPYGVYRPPFYPGYGYGRPGYGHGPGYGGGPGYGSGYHNGHYHGPRRY